MVDLEKVKAFLSDPDNRRPLDMDHGGAMDLLEALVAEVEGLRKETDRLQRAIARLNDPFGA